MIKLPAIFPHQNEGLSTYIKRLNYSVRRRLIPSVRKIHRLESLVGPIGYWKPLQEYQISFLKNMGLSPNHTLLDIGCGPLQGGIKLIEYLEPNHYFGVDLRPDPIIEAYKQVAHHKLVHKNPTLLVSSSFGKDELTNHTFDLFWMSQLLYHLPLEAIGTLLQHIKTQMSPTSVFYGDIIDYNMELEQNANWSGFKFHNHQPNELQEIAGKAGLGMDILGQVEDHGYPLEIGVLRKNYVLKFYPCIPQYALCPNP
jgi:SAM-dependent methyltransferase